MEYFEIITGAVSVVATILAFLFKKKYGKWHTVAREGAELAAHVIVSLEDGEMDEHEKAEAFTKLIALVEAIQSEGEDG